MPRITILAAALLVLAACSAGGDSESARDAAEVLAGGHGSADGVGDPPEDTGEPVDVMGWSAGDEVATSRLDYVGEQAPDLDVDDDENGFDQQRFATAMAAGTAPAGVSMDRQLLATYAAKGFLEPLDDCIDDAGIDLDQFYPDAVEESSWDGHVYGIPEFFTIRAVYVNNQVLEAAGLTAEDVDTSDWDALARLAEETYRAVDGNPATIGFDPKLPEYLPLWAMANGGSIVADDGSPTLDDPAVVEALDWAVGVIDDQSGWATFKSFRDTWDFFGAENEFVRDQIGVMPYEQWYANVLAGTEADFTVVPFTGRDGQPLTLETGSALAIPAGSPNAGGMCTFMKLVTSTDAWMAAAAARQEAIATDGGAFTGIFSANQDANEEMREEYVTVTSTPIDEVVETFYDALPAARMIPPSPAGQQIQQAYQQAVTDALDGQDARTALAAAQESARAAFEAATG